MSDTDEIARLRARVAELEAERAAAPPRRAPRSRGVTRSLVAGVLLTLACVLAPVSVASVWASTVLSDTDRYVETVAPVADDPAVQEALADEVTIAVMENLDVEALTAQALDVVAQQDQMPPRVADALPALAVPLTSGIESFTRDQVLNLMASPRFASVWDEVNRIAHDQVVTLLEGNEGGVVSAQEDTITLNLAPIIEEVKARLVDRGFALAANIPEVDRSFVLAQSDAISQAQWFYELLGTLGTWLPFVALGLFVAGVFVARDRRLALLRGALGVTVAMVVLGVGLLVVRTLYVETTPAGVLTPDAAGNVFDTLVRFLRSSMRALGVLGLLVALVAYLSGPSESAARARSRVGRGVRALQAGSDARGWSTGPVGGWVHANRKVLRGTAFVVGGFALMFFTTPTVGVVIGVGLLVLLALLVIELLARPPGEPVSAGGPQL
jgi:hypothetical protein